MDFPVKFYSISDKLTLYGSIEWRNWISCGRETPLLGILLIGVAIMRSEYLCEVITILKIVQSDGILCGPICISFKCWIQLSCAVQDMSSNENMKKYFYTQQIYFSVQTTHSFTISPHLNSFGVHVTA